MSIRADFQPRIDEFLSDLETFATGSYLKPEEKELWDQPFDPAALPELRALLEGYADRLDRVPADPDVEVLRPVVARTVDELSEFNSRHADAVLEPEEFGELNAIISEAAAATGAEEEALHQLPVLE